MKISYLMNNTKNCELIICNQSLLSYPIHNHVSMYIISLIIDGVIEVSTPLNSQLYRKEEVFVIPPYLPHKLSAVEEYSMVSLCINKSEILNKKTHSLQEKVFSLLAYVSILNELQKKVILQKLNELQFNEGINVKTFSNSINNIRQQLELFPEKKININDMAKSSFVSKYHFIRNFKHEIGLTPHQFQIQNRIRKAKRLLHCTENITEVALSSGFCDQSHFIKQFKKIVQLTPSKFMLSCNTLKHIDN